MGHLNIPVACIHEYEKEDGQLTYADLCKIFCEIESEFGLFDVEYEGTKYWKYARYYVYRALLNKLFGIHTPWMENEKVTVAPKYNHWYQRFTDSIFHNIDTATQKDILLFTFNRRVKRDGKYVSPVSDEIALNLKRSKCAVEALCNGGYYRPTPIWNIKYFDPWSGVGESSHDKNRLLVGKFRKQVLAPFEENLHMKFTREEKYRLSLNVNFFIMDYKKIMENFTYVIQKINPKLALLSSSYIGEQIVLIEALRKFNIPSVEILHGYVDDHYLPYNYARVGMHDAQPDYILAYSQIQKESVHWGIERDRVRVVGFPEGEKRSAQLLAKAGKREKKRILFISSMQSQIIKYIDKLADHLDNREYEIVFKLHPNEYAAWRDLYENVPEKVCVVDNNKRDIHYFLANSDIVVGINSTALFEASYYPVDIFILKEESYQNMEILLKAGGGCLLQDEEELLYHVLHLPKRNPSRDTCLYKRNAIDNINREIEKILNEQT